MICTLCSAGSHTFRKEEHLLVGVSAKRIFSEQA